MHLKHAFFAAFSTLTLAACASGPGSSGSGSVATAGAASPAVEAAAPATAAAPAVTAVPAAQARQGENAFLSSCTACHASSEFSANAFRRRWSNRTAGDLFDLVSGTMPEDAPGSLAPDQYVDIVAYMLSLNGFETSQSGDVWDVEALGGVSLGPLGSR